MATNYTENPIVDPDQMSFQKTTNIATAWAAVPTEEIVIDYVNKLIGLYVGSSASPSNLTNDGATIKAVYSKLKDIWKDDVDLIKFPFPMGPITDEQFEMINGWNWDRGQAVSPARTSGTDGIAADTVELLRTGGWQVVNTGGTTTEEWAGIISLGSLAATDQVYYQQAEDETTDNTTNFILKGKVNQAVQIFDAAPSPDTSLKTYFKMFVREWKKTYGVAAFTDIGVTTATFQAYRFPLTNATDLNVTHAEEVINNTAGFITSISGTGTVQTYTTSLAHGLVADDIVTISGSTTAGYNGTSLVVTGAPTTTSFTVAGSESGATSTAAVQLDLYGAMSITYSRDSGDARVTLTDIKGVWSSGQAYIIGDVVQDTNTPARWFIVTTGGTSSGDATNLAGGSDTGVSYSSYTFEREINTDNWYAFNVAIDADTGTANANDGDANTFYTYEFVQAQLRKASDIDAANPGTVIGKTADKLLTFVGPTLVTSAGVYIDSFASGDTNSIQFTDYSGTVREFNFVALFTINFGDNLKQDPYSKYYVFFTTSGGTDENYGEINAVLVDHVDPVPGDMTGLVNPTNTPNERSFVAHQYDYDTNVQRGVGTDKTDAPVTVIGIGLEKSQWVLATGTIKRDKTSSVTLTSALERNYSQGSSFP
jgi:hypothetical protein